ncbi:TonB-dependent receptor [Aliiglaciecola sp. CAU 1673]|uniref:TonB-dependent receptor n=1 Tax=Aliiglaciecola sp. CAU 1673 TaxID=3032595 RepID=UPI0023DB9284|nr:TonB-dependent receptor [Aliiglaciecola sp. CAU 1673]MDF2180081.1 TonB-dependent receptor [Aliiglaciecola sp. CAU 1673]
MKITKKTLSLCIGLACLPALADDAASIEHILVSADFSGQSLQNLPASVSVISQQQITERQAQTLDQILGAAPNVNVNAGASRGRFFQIRGIGERSQFAEPINPSVGFFVDDVDLSGIAGAATLFDVEQVEVLKGPQATEFGANALAGAIKIKTVEANANQTNQINLSLAEQNTWSAGVATGSALTDKLFFRVAAQQFKSDGFIDNIYLHRDDTNNLDELTSRLKLKYLASDHLTLDLSYQYFDIDNGYDAFSLDNDRRTRSDEPGFDRQKTHALSFKADWRLGWGSLKLIAAASDSDLAYGYDEDWTYVGFHPWEYSSFDAYFRDRQSQSLEIRAQSNEYSRWFNGKTDWVIGIYAKQTDEELQRQYTYADSDFSSHYEPQSQALYINTFTQLSEDTRLTAGVRVDSIDIRYQDNSGFAESLEDTIVGGKLVLDHNVAEQAMVYLGVSRGYKASGFNPDERISEDKRLFDPEYSWNYETGVKGSLFDGLGTLRLAVFYMERKDTQISDFDVLIREDGTADFVDVIDNADNGTNYGLELESQWQLTPDFALFANLGWLRATFEGYENAKGEVIQKRDQAQSPRYTANLGFDWALGADWHWHLEADAKDEHFFSDGHNERSDAYVLLHSRVSYQLADWSLSLWGRNLLDKEYQVRGFGGFNNDPREFYETPKPYYQLGDGRQLGVSAQYRF